MNSSSAHRADDRLIADLTADLAAALASLLTATIDRAVTRAITTTNARPSAAPAPRPETKPQPVIIRPKDVAKMLGVSLPTLWRWERDRTLGFPKGIRLGKYTKGWRATDLTAYLERQQRG